MDIIFSFEIIMDLKQLVIIVIISQIEKKQAQILGNDMETKCHPFIVVNMLILPVLLMDSIILDDEADHLTQIDENSDHVQMGIMYQM
jgi:hypothetical protein